jgi:hypothetical protein
MEGTRQHRLFLDADDPSVVGVSEKGNTEAISRVPALIQVDLLFSPLQLPWMHLEDNEQLFELIYKCHFQSALHGFHSLLFCGFQRCMVLFNPVMISKMLNSLKQPAAATIRQPHVVVIGGSYAGVSAVQNMLGLLHGGGLRPSPIPQRIPDLLPAVTPRITVLDRRDGFCQYCYSAWCSAS